MRKSHGRNFKEHLDDHMHPPNEDWVFFVKIPIHVYKRVFLLAVELMIVMGPGIVIFTGVSVMAWLACHSFTHHGSGSMCSKGPRMVGTYVLHAPLRYTLYVKFSKSKFFSLRL